MIGTPSPWQQSPMLSGLFLLRYAWSTRLHPADKRDRIVRVVCKRNFLWNIPWFGVHLVFVFCLSKLRLVVYIIRRYWSWERRLNTKQNVTTDVGSRVCTMYYMFSLYLWICFVFSKISVLGSDGGTRSMINRCKQCLQVAIENTPGVISANEDREFYISWAGKAFSATLAWVRKNCCTECRDLLG